MSFFCTVKSRATNENPSSSMVKAGGLYSFPNLKIQGQLYIATGSTYNSKSVVVDFFFILLCWKIL